MANDEKVVRDAYADGALHRWNAVHWWKLKGGKLASFHEFVDDPSAFARAWHH